MRGVVLTVPRTEWACPSCDLTEVTQQAGPHLRMHACGGFHGATIPMVHADEVRTARHVPNEREDYLAGDDKLVRRIGGRPIMNITTEHADGSTDCTVYAPTALGTAEGLGRG